MYTVMSFLPRGVLHYLQECIYIVFINYNIYINFSILCINSMLRTAVTVIEHINLIYHNSCHNTGNELQCLKIKPNISYKNSNMINPVFPSYAYPYWLG
jgi:hypothetical protein